MTGEAFDMRAEISDLRRTLAAREAAVERAERRLADARTDARTLAQQNEALNATLREARASLVALKDQLEALGTPPHQVGVLLRGPFPGRTADEADVAVGGRVLRVVITPEADRTPLVPGASVLLNEALTLIRACEAPQTGDVVRVREALDDGRLVVTTNGDEELVMLRAPELADAPLDAGDSLLADRRALVAFSQVFRSDVEGITLDEVPDVTYADIGGLDEQIAQITDAVELPFKHRDLFAAYGLKAPKGVLLYGPPGCGKTMIAKAVANSAGSAFLNIKGPELLNKYVGETERQIRLTFARARELSDAGRPVIIFFDEMDSLFRTRGSGVSSDVESTVVPQLLAEIDGVEALSNVIVIGATNREDLIDPAILRPGRLDVKIKLERPSKDAAGDIMSRYLPASTPFNPDEADRVGGVVAQQRRCVQAAVDELYARSEQNEFVEVTYASGERETLYVSDFISGAMLAQVAARAKKAAVKDVLAGRDPGVTLRHVIDACRDEVAENEELVNTTNPDDWARISGKKGERITYLRTLHGSRALRVD